MTVSCFTIVNADLTYEGIISTGQISTEMRRLLFFMCKTGYSSHWAQKIVILHLKD